MAVVCPVDLDTLTLRKEIQSIYARVAADPAGDFHFHRGPAYLPVDSATVDAVMSNGVLNLTPDKMQAFGEGFRVLKSGGQFLYGDITIASELPEAARRNIELWTG